MESHRASDIVAAPELASAKFPRRRSRKYRAVLDLTGAPRTPEEDVLLFELAPISQVELPTNGGAGTEPFGSHLAMMSIEGTSGAGGGAAAVRARTERARQVLRAMLRPAERAAG